VSLVGVGSGGVLLSDGLSLCLHYRHTIKRCHEVAAMVEKRVDQLRNGRLAKLLSLNCIAALASNRGLMIKGYLLTYLLT